MIRGATVRCQRWLEDAVTDLSANEDGDVPGWVLITLMTAALVFAIWALAGTALVELFNSAIDRFQGM